jgi:hypothetical protein
MFHEMRNHLTILYTGVMAIFLAAFIAVSDVGVLWVLHDEEKQDILSFAEEEARELLPRLKKNTSTSEQKVFGSDAAGEKIFSYAFDNNGQLVDAQKPTAKMRAKVEEIISGWQDADGEGRIKKILLPNGERVFLIMCSIQVKDQGELLGRIYVGEDVTSYYELLKNLLLVLIVVSIFFLIMSVCELAKCFTITLKVFLSPIPQFLIPLA